ncbi:amidohydrolase, partial [Gammaproteobacteria bacterium]|nr:amidohydrolase [Gammaproteobacteria bacterium]
DNILFETDFPHPTSLFGSEISDRISEGLGDCAPEVKEKILWGNAAKLYRVEVPVGAHLAVGDA